MGRGPSGRRSKGSEVLVSDGLLKGGLRVGGPWSWKDEVRWTEDPRARRFGGLKVECVKVQSIGKQRSKGSNGRRSGWSRVLCFGGSEVRMAGVREVRSFGEPELRSFGGLVV